MKSFHLPMEPFVSEGNRPRRSFTDMNDEEILQLQRNVDSSAVCSGVNNHMGPKFMADEEKLTLVFRDLKRKFVFYRFPDHLGLKTEARWRTKPVDVMSRKSFWTMNATLPKFIRILWRLP